MKKTIFPAKSQPIQEFFLNAPSLEKVLIIPVDYAKKSHTIQFCLGTGELLLKKALTIYNTPAGLDYLLNLNIWYWDRSCRLDNSRTRRSAALASYV